MQESVQKSDCGICRQSLKWYQRKEDMILYENIARVHRKCRREFIRELKKPKTEKKEEVKKIPSVTFREEATGLTLEVDQNADLETVLRDVDARTFVGVFTEYEIHHSYNVLRDGVPSNMRFEGVRLDFSNNPNMTAIRTPETHIRLEWEQPEGYPFRIPEFQEKILRKIETTFSFIIPYPTDEFYPREFVERLMQMFQQNMRHNIMFEYESEQSVGRVFLDRCFIHSYNRSARGGTPHYLDMKLIIICEKIRRQHYDRE
jgi:hypothetical protein